MKEFEMRCMECGKITTSTVPNKLFCSYECHKINEKKFKAEKKKRIKEKAMTKVDSPCIGCLFENECEKECISYKIYNGKYVGYKL